MIALNISGASAQKGMTAAHSAMECATELDAPGFAAVVAADERHRVQLTAPGTLTPPSTSGILRLAGHNDFLADDATNALPISGSPAGESQVTATFDLDVREIWHETKAQESPAQFGDQPIDGADAVKHVAPADADTTPIGSDETRGRSAEDGRSESVVDLSEELIGTGEVLQNPRAQDLSVRVDAAPRGSQAEQPESEAPPTTKYSIRVGDGALEAAQSESSLLDWDAATTPKAAVQPLQASGSDREAAVPNTAAARSRPGVSDDEHVAPLTAKETLAADLDLNDSTSPTVRSSAGPNRGGIPSAMAPMTLSEGKNAAEHNADGATNSGTYSRDTGVSRKLELAAQGGLIRSDQTVRPRSSAASHPGPIPSGPDAPPRPEKRVLDGEATSAQGFANRSGPTRHGSESLDVQAPDSVQLEPVDFRAGDAHQTSRSRTAGTVDPDQVRRGVDKPTTQFVGDGGRIMASRALPANGKKALPPSDAPVVPESIGVASYRLSWNPTIRESHHHLGANGALLQKGSDDEIVVVPSVQPETSEVPDLSDKGSLKPVIATSFEVASDRQGPMAFSSTRPRRVPTTNEGSDLLALPLESISRSERTLPAQSGSGREIGQSVFAPESHSESSGNPVAERLPYSPLGAHAPRTATVSVATEMAFVKEAEASINPVQVRAVADQGAAADLERPAHLSVFGHAGAQQSSLLRAYASERRTATSVKSMATTASTDPTKADVISAPVTSQKPASSFRFASPEGPHAGTGSLEGDLPRSRSSADVLARPGIVPQSADLTALPQTAVAGVGLRDLAGRLKVGDQMSRPRERASGMPTTPDQTARPVPLSSGPSGADSVAARAPVAKPELDMGPRLELLGGQETRDPSGANIRRPYSDRDRGQDQSAVRIQGPGSARLDGPGIGERAAVDLSGSGLAGVKGPDGQADRLPAEYGPAIFQTNAAPRSAHADRLEKTKAPSGEAEVAPGGLASLSAPPAVAHPGTRSEKSGAVGAQAVAARKTVLAGKPMPDLAMPNLVPGTPDFERAVTAASDPTPAAGPHHAHGLPGHLPATLAKAASAASADDRVELLLDPVELGKVRFELTSTADRVQVNVSVERPETLDLLRRNIDVLRAEFRDAGFDASTLSFSQWGKGGDSAPQSPFVETALANDLAAEDVASPTPLLARNTSRQGLDLRL